MTRFVVDGGVVLELAREGYEVPAQHELFAPTLLRSQVLSSLYQSVRRGELTRADAKRRLEHVRGLRIRLLGDSMMQSVAWRIADKLGWADTLDAEYLAVTTLQADAFVTLDAKLAAAVKDIVTVAPFDELPAH